MNILLQQRALEICTTVMDVTESERAQTIQSLAKGDGELIHLVTKLLDRINLARDWLPTAGAEVSGINLSGTRIEEYHLDRLLGSGGMGSVYLAHRTSNGVRQDAALKVMNAVTPNPSEITRFIREQQALATLHHPYIAALIDIGLTDRSIPYLVMEYVPGVPISQWCMEQQPNIAERVRIWLRICEAVQHAHQNLVVHRDIKPANILVSVDGLPKLLDFGIAKLLGTEDDVRTSRFARHLTLEYATPERILRNAVSTSEDIYALGVLLFELICGKRPFQRSDQTIESLASNLDHELPPTLWASFNTQTVEQQTRIAAERGLSVRALKNLLKGDLDAICRHALHPDKERRFQSVDLLAADLHAWLRGEPVKARGDSSWYRLSRFVGRHRVGMAAGLVAATGLMVATTVYVHQANIVQKQAQQALAVNEFLQEMLAAPNARWDTQWRGHADLRMSELLELASSHLNTRLQDQPQVRVQLYGSLARSFAALSMYERALVEQRKAHLIVTTRLPAEDPSQPAVATTVATMLDYLGSPTAIAEARLHLEAALNWFDTYEPGPSRDRAATIGELGYSHHVAEEFSTAIKYYLEAMDVHRAAGGDPADPLVALGSGLLGLAYLDNTQHAEATQWLDRSLSIYELPANNSIVDATHVYSARAALYLRSGEFQAALAASRRSLELSEQAQDRKSPDYLEILAESVHVHCTAATDRDCEHYLDQAEDILEAAPSSEPMLRASLKLMRAEQLLTQGQASAALSLLEPHAELATIKRVRSQAGFNAAGRWHLAMGQALLATDQPDKAKRHLDLGARISKDW